MLATVLFTDIVGSTSRAAELGDHLWRELLERHNALVRGQLDSFQGEEAKHTGDGFLATFDGPARAIRCACAIRDHLRELGIEIRAGLHTGECEFSGGDVGGLAVHIGARVMSKAGAGEILVSSTVKDLVVGSGIEFDARGAHTLKARPENGPYSPSRATPVNTLDHLQPNWPTRPDLNERVARTLARRAPSIARASVRVLRR